MSVTTIETGIEGARIELQPMFGDLDGAVFHMLPGGDANPDGFGGRISDVYAFSAKGRGTFRGGHYHLKLDELFFTMSGTALWLLSDFRQDSTTKDKTIGLIVGEKAPATDQGVPTHVLEQGSLARLRVPAGVYHAVFPLTDERVTAAALGSTPYDKEDYRHPKIEDVPGALDLLEKFGIRLTSA